MTTDSHQEPLEPMREDSGTDTLPAALPAADDESIRLYELINGSVLWAIVRGAFGRSDIEGSFEND